MRHLAICLKLLLPIVVLDKYKEITVTILVALLSFGCSSVPNIAAQHAETSAVFDSAVMGQLTNKSQKNSCVVNGVQINASKPLGYDRLVGWATNNAPSLSVAQTMIKQAQGGKYRTMYWTPYNPTIQTEFGLRQFPTDSGLDVGVSLQQQFEVGGQRQLRRNVVQANVAHAKARFDETCWSLKIQIKKTYALAQLSRKRLDLIASLTKLYEKSYQLAQKRVQVDQEAKSTLLAFKVDLAQLKQQELTAKSSYDVQLGQLKRLIGWPPSRRLILLEDDGVLNYSKLPKLRRIIKKAMTQNKVLRVQAMMLSRAQAKSTLQEREGWVDPTIGVSYGREGGIEPVHLFMFSLSVDIPLFDRNQSNIANAQADVLVQRAKLGQHANIIRAQIEQAYSQHKAAHEQLSVYTKTIEPTLQQDMQNIQKSFKAGELGLSKLIQVQRRILMIELSKLDAQRRMIIARTRLEQLAGGLQ